MSPSITLDYLEFEFVSEQLTKSLIVIAEFDKEITSLVAKKAQKEFVKFLESCQDYHQRLVQYHHQQHLLERHQGRLLLPEQVH